MELESVPVPSITEIVTFYAWTACIFFFIVLPKELDRTVRVCVTLKSLTNQAFFLSSSAETWQQTFAHTLTKPYCTARTHTHHFGCSSTVEIFHSSQSWREILNNKYPANNECAAGCSCLGGIISNFLPMFHIPTPACRHSPSLHPNAGSYHFYLFFKSIYKSKPGQMRSNKLQSAGQMQNVNCVPGEEIPMGAACCCSVLCATAKSTKCHIKSQLTWILLSAVFNTGGKTPPRPYVNKFCEISSICSYDLYILSHILLS